LINEECIISVRALAMRMSLTYDLVRCLLSAVYFLPATEREQKKERLIVLREKFELDKLKIAKMKQERKFKPY
jgi:hypothetical protein